MLASTSPSPSISARPANFRAYGSSPRSSPSSTATTKAPKPNQSLKTSSNSSKLASSVNRPADIHPSQAQPPTQVDAGTQYTPPDWPPTDPRSSLFSRENTSETTTTTTSSTTLTESEPARPRAQEAADPAGQDEQATTAAVSSSIDRSGSQLRITPHSSLHNASRRLHPDGDGTSSGLESPPSSKRARRMEGSKKHKVMPADYVKCEPKLLAGIIAEMLMRLIRHNDEIPLQDGQLTRFHSRAPPGISVHDYLARLTFHATLATPILLSMVFFIDRLSANYSTFIINSLTVHRFLITAATVASKGLSDSFWTNQTYARVGGVSVKELALLELELLIKCGWRIVPGPEQLVEYYHGLVEQSEEWVLEGQETESSEGTDVPPAAEETTKKEASDDEMDTSDGAN